MEKEAVVSDYQKVAETLSNFFEEAVDRVDIKPCNNISNTVMYSDPVEIAIKKYEYHPSIFIITE